MILTGDNSFTIGMKDVSEIAAYETISCSTIIGMHVGCLSKRKRYQATQFPKFYRFGQWNKS